MVHPASATSVGVLDTIKTLLLRESHWRRTILDRLHGLLGRCRGEGPARATVALVFYWIHFFLLNPIDVEIFDLIVLQETTAIVLVTLLL